MRPPKQCPICGSTTDWIRTNMYHEGFSVLKALIGGLLLRHWIGFLAGLIGKRKVVYVCRQCNFTAEYKR